MNTNYRIRFARSEPAIWLAHLDMMRTFERSIRRARLPVAWSQGYNPRPHLEFALPIGVGLATEDDYVDILMTEPIDESDLLKQLNQNLPAGLQGLEAKVIPVEGASLMSLITMAEYQLDGLGLAAAAGKILAMETGQPWPATKNSKGKQIEVDVRPLLLHLTVVSDNCLVVRVKAGSRENLRPDLLLHVMVSLGGLDALAAADTSVTRKRLWIRNPDLKTSEASLEQDQLIRPLDLVSALS